jgi:hypothetical protein
VPEKWKNYFELNEEWQDQIIIETINAIHDTDNWAVASIS